MTQNKNFSQNYSLYTREDLRCLAAKALFDKVSNEPTPCQAEGDGKSTSEGVEASR